MHCKREMPLVTPKGMRRDDGNLHEPRTLYIVSRGQQWKSGDMHSGNPLLNIAVRYGSNHLIDSW